MTNSEVKVIGAWPSPFVMRAPIALHLKCVDYEFLAETLDPKSELLLKMNPVHKKVPVLLHHGKPVNESTVIVHYIDEVVFSSGSSILPSDAYERAIYRFWVAYLDDKLFPSMMGTLRAETVEAKVAGIEQVKEGVLLLEEAFNKLSNGKPFFGGDKFRYLDIGFGCFLGWLRVSEKLSNMKLLDEEATPSLVGWADRFCADEAVKDIMPDTDELAEFSKILMARQRAAAAST